MSDIRKGGQLKSQESVMNKTMASPGGFANIFASPTRPMTGEANKIISPKKKSTYHLSNLNQENETVQKLKEKIDHFIKYKDNPH
jgi:hypothetical protein